MKKYIFPDSALLKIALTRPSIDAVDMEELVKSIFDDVSIFGDQAIQKYTERFDGVTLNELLVSSEEISLAEKALSTELKAAIKLAANNIKTFHESQHEEILEIETMPGVVCWRKSVGIDKVGLYIPGGTAPLFSTVLMLGIPALIAGCKQIVLCTPTRKDGSVHPAVLYTANLIGIKEVYKVGGVQAIAGMSLGTSTIPKVYKLFGPGNQYVTAAKQYAQKLGIAIDMPAGPSELMVVADENSNATFIAADLLSQAEHGSDSQVVLVATDNTIIEKVEIELTKQLADLPRKATAEMALENSSAILVQKVEMLSIINEYAPEHLILQTSFNEELLNGIVNAGSVFIGEYTPESAGDYASGTNHTLPTNGFAKQYSGVSLDSFVKKITFQQISKNGIQQIGSAIQEMAAAEGLDAHKNAVTVRLKNIKA
jgi:histidinol dehydrogenase